MNLQPTPGERPATPHLFTTLVLLWLAGAAIRIPLLAVPPVIPLIHDDLHMSETQVGILMGLPLVMFAMAAVPGSLLIARFGVLRVATAGLAICVARRGGSVRRGRHLDALCRDAADGLWRRHLPAGVSDAGPAVGAERAPGSPMRSPPTACWSAQPSHRLEHSHRAAAGRRQLADRSADLVGARPGRCGSLCRGGSAPPSRRTAGPPRSRWPDWRSPELWLLGITLGVNNALFFAANAFVPDYLTHTGRGGMIGMTLGWLNGSQLVGSFVMLAMAERFQRGTWPFTIFGPVTLLGLLGIVLCDGIWLVRVRGRGRVSAPR